MLSHSDTFFGNSDFMHKLMLYKCFPNKKTRNKSRQDGPIWQTQYCRKERRYFIKTMDWEFLDSVLCDAYSNDLCILGGKKNSIFLQKSTILHSG